MRLRRSLYCTPDLDARAVAALRIGGVAGCVTALELWGVWVTASSAIHIHVAPNAARLARRGPSTEVHWAPLHHPADAVRVSVLDAVLAGMLCQRFVDAVASVDSALHLGLVSRVELTPFCADRRRARVLAACDGRAESGLESIVRVILRALGLRVEVQVRIRGVGRVDLLVEGAVIVETDGAAFHSGPRRHADHARDAAAAAAGFTPLRFDSAQVLGDPIGVALAVLGAVRAHRGARFSGLDAAVARRRLSRVLSA